MSYLGLRIRIDKTLMGSFTYAVLPGVKMFSPIDWKLLEKEDIEGEHIRCHQLQENEKLIDLLETFDAKAVILFNTSDNYCLAPELSFGIKEPQVPVVLLTKADGEKVLQYFEDTDEISTNVYARIDVETDIDEISAGNPTFRASGGTPQQHVSQAKEQSSDSSSSNNIFIVTVFP